MYKFIYAECNRLRPMFIDNIKIFTPVTSSI